MLGTDDITTLHNYKLGGLLYRDIENCVRWYRKLRRVDSEEEIFLKRDMAYCSDTAAIYYYDKFEMPVQPFNSLLNYIRAEIQEIVGIEYNSVLLNKYKDGKDKINWHSDKEEQLGDKPIITCVNFGATRQFRFLNKETGEKTAYPVGHGDVLVMGEACQKKFLHAILPEKEVTEPRISLTFRKVAT